ncbi:serine protease [Streptomyces sp. NPDC058045]|uniref:serine protease n=1 Tax=Streptomyces sp. NPDC058045 TaxID=3346311 RepID=UPI0036E0670B
MAPRGGAAVADEAEDPTLVRISDPAGRPLGTGFAADHHGTVITAHTVVDGRDRLVLHAPGDLTRVLTGADITPLPAQGLALLRTEGLGLRPLPVTVRARPAVGGYVRLAAGGWREARVLGTGEPPAEGGTEAVPGGVRVAIGTDGSDALRRGGHTGGPVCDAATGAVLAVLAGGAAAHPAHTAGGHAHPLRSAAAADPDGPLAALLARNAATVPGTGADLNLAAVLQLTAVSVGSGAPRPGPEYVERPEVAAEFTTFTESGAAVLALVGEPGTGRTTELAALAARRAHGAAPAPTLWLRGADLHAEDPSLGTAATRALARAARIVSASGEGVSDAEPPGDEGELGEEGPTAEEVARAARDGGRPLLILLDAPEEMPPGLAHRLPDWTSATARWLRTHGVRLVLTCRSEHWHQTGPHLPPDLLHGSLGANGLDQNGSCRCGDGDGANGGSSYGGCGGEGEGCAAGANCRCGQGDCAHREHRSEVPWAVGDGPPCVPLGDLSAEQAERARAAHGIPAGVLAPADARHPLALRLLAEVRAACPEAVHTGRPTREQLFEAHLALQCLRIAARLPTAERLGPPAVRRLAVRAAGRVHQAARRCLGPGQGELGRADFEEVFPWRTGWASAVLAEGVLVPAGNGYRFAHEEPADWLQGAHLDLEPALDALVHQRAADPAQPPVPRHRIGPVVQSLLLLARQQGSGQLARKLEELTRAAETLADAEGRGDGDADAGEGAWWAVRLVAGVLVKVPDAGPYLEVLRSLAGRVVARCAAGRPVPAVLGPGFWAALAVDEQDRLELMRTLVVTDGPRVDGPRHLDAVAGLLTADPVRVQARLTGWFTDSRPLPATPGATVAAAAQALLHTHRRRAPDALTETLLGCPHPRAEELLAVLAEEEPSAMCRAVDRWARDERPDRHIAAAVHALAVAPHATARADRLLLRHTALTLLGRSQDDALRGAVLGLLVRDPDTRARYLPQALRQLTSPDGYLPADAVSAALTGHPGQTLAALRIRLSRRGGVRTLLRALADADPAPPARPMGRLLLDLQRLRPEDGARHAALYVDRRLTHGPAARRDLPPLVTRLLAEGPVPLRAALAVVLAGPGPDGTRQPVRAELLEQLLAQEEARTRDSGDAERDPRDPEVLAAVLRSAVDPAAVTAAVTAAEPMDTAGLRDPVQTAHPADRMRGLVRRTGLLLVAGAQGAACFDRCLVERARAVPGFAVLLGRWLAERPQEWDTLVGPSARRLIGDLAREPAPGPEARTGPGTGAGTPSAAAAGGRSGAGHSGAPMRGSR